MSSRLPNFNAKLAKILFNKDIEALQSNFVVIKNGQRKYLKVFIKIKSNLKLILQLIIIFISLILFFIQASKLTFDYFNYETVVKVTYETEKESLLPGITVCFPFFSSWDQIKFKYPEFEHYANLSISKLYQLKKTYKFEDTKQWGEDDSVLTIDGKIVSPFKLHNYFMEKAFNETSIIEMFNMSIPTEFISNGVIIKTLNGTVFTKNNLNISNNVTESFKVDEDGNFRKCFTLYRIKMIQEAFKTNYQKIEIIISSNVNWFQNEFLNQNNYLFLLHKPDFIPIPNDGNFVKLQPDREYVILFSRIKKYLLTSPYKTNCFNYIMKSQDLCIVECLNDLAFIECGECAPRFNLHLIQFNSDPKIKLCPNQHCLGFSLKETQSRCESQCKPDCYTEFYEFHETSSRRVKKTKYDSTNKTIIKLIHKTIPDVEIKHFPDFTWSSYVANMGGLAGMCLGFSIISAYRWLSIVIKNIYIKIIK